MDALELLVALLGGGFIGFFVRMAQMLARKKSVEIDAKQIKLDAKESARKILDKAEARAEAIQADLKTMQAEKESQHKEEHDRLIKKEALLDSRQTEIDKHADQIKIQEQHVAALQAEADSLISQKKAELEKVAQLTGEQAKEQLEQEIQDQYAEDLQVRIRKLETQNSDELEKRARDILVTTIQRLASSTASEITVTHVPIPSDDIKGKVIGKEGRNIRAFERSAGVELIIDDTPGNIVISCFDPVRRQVARVALEALIKDGRIQPAKIEEVVEEARQDINQIIKEKGEWAVNELGIYNLDARIVSIIGRLYFRTSYGQNVLMHSVEMAHLAGMLAQELGANVEVAKAGALVHDIGKALDHEVQGTHVEIGIRILQKFGADERIIIAMKSHHDDWPHESIEAVIVQTCDMISGARPGARRDSIENYLKRLRELEEVANSFDQVSKAYALSAGREIRVFVTPEKVSDNQAKKTAREIAKKIEKDLRYPGVIKVTMIRENRIIEFAR